jgi:hypothetical protein
MNSQQNPVRKLTITGCKDVYHGTNNKGNDYTIFEVQAVDEHGQPVQETLKSFEVLEIGLVADFEVERYDGGQHGVSYTLKRQREKLGPRVQRLEEQVIPILERRVEHLERTMGVQPTPPQPPPAAQPPAQAPPAQQAPPPQPQSAPIDSASTARFGGDEDIPF